MIASVGPCLPLAVLRATGCYAGPLPIDLGKQVGRADAWLESKFAPWARLALQGWADGDYDHLDRVIFSRADDTAQRLYYYVCELQRRGFIAGPQAVIFDIALVDRPSSLARTGSKVRELAALLAVDEAAIAAALPGPDPLPAAASDGPLCIIAGSPLPDHRLHEAAAAAGFRAEGQTLTDFWTFEPAIEPGQADPLEAIARSLHLGATGPRSFAERGAALARSLAHSGARAAVLWRIEEDEAQTWHLPAELRALADSGMPHLVLTRRDWLAGDGAADEITAFLREIAA